jgi:hypothetical protein
MKRALIVLAAVAAVAGVAGCDSANQKDVKGVQPQANPGNITVWANIDQHPNIARVCADGLAFITTSRDNMPINRLPEWDWACPKPPGFVPYKGQPTNLLNGPLTVVHSSN